MSQKNTDKLKVMPKKKPDKFLKKWSPKKETNQKQFFKKQTNWKQDPKQTDKL